MNINEISARICEIEKEIEKFNAVVAICEIMMDIQERNIQLTDEDILRLISRRLKPKYSLSVIQKAIDEVNQIK